MGSCVQLHDSTSLTSFWSVVCVRSMTLRDCFAERNL